MFFRYPAHSKRYVVYKECPNYGITQIDSCNVDYLEDDFHITGEIKKYIELYELQQDIQPSFHEDENLNSNQVIKDDALPLSESNDKDLSAQENKALSQSPILDEI